LNNYMPQGCFSTTFFDRFVISESRGCVIEAGPVPETIDPTHTVDPKPPKIVPAVSASALRQIEFWGPERGTIGIRSLDFTAKEGVCAPFWTCVDPRFFASINPRSKAWKDQRWALYDMSFSAPHKTGLHFPQLVARRMRL
jgi:hypothetical protein